MKEFFEAMKIETVKKIANVTFNLIDISAKQTTNPETGEISNFIKVDVEIPKKMGAFSRKRISVKIQNGILKIEPQKLDEYDFLVTFKNLAISYVDDHKNVYFRAEDYTVVEESVNTIFEEV